MEKKIKDINTNVCFYDILIKGNLMPYPDHYPQLNKIDRMKGGLSKFDIEDLDKVQETVVRDI